MNNEPNNVPTPEAVPLSPQTEGGISKKIVKDIFDWIELFTITIAVIISFFNLIIRPAYVEGESMTNTLQDKDVLLTSSFAYTPKTGDIVVIQDPLVLAGKPLVKRVIATGGQTVRIDYDNWKVYVDGKLLDEDYVLYREGVPMNGCYWADFTEEQTVPEGKVFVMGDNRNGSSDSRYFGYIDESAIFGHAIIRLLPFKSFGAL